MFIIGELINSTRKRIRTAVENKDADYIREVAVRQAEAGAKALDVNGGVAGREAECLKWLVDVVQDTVDLPLCLDSSDPAFEFTLKSATFWAAVVRIEADARSWQGSMYLMGDEPV